MLSSTRVNTVSCLAVGLPCLAHVVDGERGHRRPHHRLHLHTSLASTPCLAFNLQQKNFTLSYSTIWYRSHSETKWKMKMFRVIHPVIQLGWVDFNFNIQQCHMSALPILLVFHLPKPNWADR